MKYVTLRFLRFAAVFVIVTFGVTVLMRLGSNSPEDLAITLLGDNASDAQLREAITRYHLDENIVLQYWYWLKGLFSMDLGFSVQRASNVTDLLRPRLWTTAFLATYSLIAALVIAIPVAMYQAYRRDTLPDRVLNFASFAFVSAPSLVLAPVFVYIFIIKLGWLPRIWSRSYPWNDLREHVRQYLLPVISLTLPLAAIYSRLLRADLVLTLQSDYISLANAKGVPPWRILLRHALRNSMFTLLTAMGVTVGTLIAGAVVVEQYFSMAGLGTLLVEGVVVRDLFLVQGIVALLSLAIVAINLFVDVIYAVIDPRIKHERRMS